MENRIAFLRWCLVFALILFGVSCLINYGMFSIINAGDITKISFVILAVFSLCSCLIGWETYRQYKGKGLDLRRVELAWFTANQLLTLGLIGTVVGFIYMLSATFAEIDPTKVVSMQSALANMAVGMSTALYTTATGLVCSLLLKLQIINIEYHLEQPNDTA